MPLTDNPPAKNAEKPAAPSNAHAPEGMLRLSYNEPTVLGVVQVSDLDGQGVGYDCVARKPDGSTQRFQRSASGTTLSDTLKVIEPVSEQDKYVSTSCMLGAQTDTTMVRDSAFIPKRVVQPPLTSPPSGALLDLGSAGANGRSYSQNLVELTEAMFRPENHLAEIRAINGKPLMLVPWYSTSSSSNISDLHGSPYISSPSRDHFMMVTDELSEACMVAAAGSNNERMRAFRNTIDALRGTAGLPGWIAEVNGTNIVLRDPGSASDATARLGLCMYTASKNSSLDASDRASYKSLADDLLRRHMQSEYTYVAGGVTSPVTGRKMQYIAAGGAGTASAGLSGMEMWQGYYGDIALFLLAGYASTGDAAVLERMRDVVDQSLVAAQYDPKNPQAPHTGHFKMKWQDGSTLSAREPSAGDWYWQQGNPSWDAADAPRFLDIFRILEEAKKAGEDTNKGVYAPLRSLGEALISTGTQTATSSCMQYYLDGRVVQGNCGGNPFANGIGGQMMLGLRPSWVKSKVDAALQGIDWSKDAAWGMQVPGIYQSARLPKLLIAAGGLDAAVYMR